MLFSDSQAYNKNIMLTINSSAVQGYLSENIFHTKIILDMKYLWLKVIHTIILNFTEKFMLLSATILVKLARNSQINIQVR